MLFNSIFSLLKKIKFNPSLLKFFNVWFFNNASCFLEKLQSYMMMYTNFVDNLLSKKIKIISGDWCFIQMLLPLIKLIMVSIMIIL